MSRPVITLSLLERFRSVRMSLSAQGIAALRNEFGGHAVKSRRIGLMISDKQHNLNEIPLHPARSQRKKADIKPFILVIFGGSGDLSRRKLLPLSFISA